MNPQHFGSDLADVRIRVRINPNGDSNPGSLLVDVTGGLFSLTTA